MILVSTSWCVQCNPVKKFIEDNSLQVQIVDADENMEWVQGQGIRSLPTLVVDGDMIVGQKDVMGYLKEVV